MLIRSRVASVSTRDIAGRVAIAVIGIGVEIGIMPKADAANVVVSVEVGISAQGN